MEYEQILSDVVDTFNGSTVYEVTAADRIDDLALDTDTIQSVEDALMSAYPMAEYVRIDECVTVGDVASAIQECMG